MRDKFSEWYGGMTVITLILVHSTLNRVEGGTMTVVFFIVNMRNGGLVNAVLTTNI